MSLQNIQLPGIVMVQLYKDLLVAGSDAESHANGTSTANQAATVAEATIQQQALPDAALVGAALDSRGTPAESNDTLAEKAKGKKAPAVGDKESKKVSETDNLSTNGTNSDQVAGRVISTTDTKDKAEPNEKLPRTANGKNELTNEAEASETQAVKKTTRTKGTSESEDKTEGYRFLGKNSKQVAVLVNSPDDAFIADEDLQILTKILGACKLNLGDIALINAATLPPEIALIKEQLQPQKMLLFGIKPAQIGLPIDFPEFKQQTYAGTTFVHAPAISSMRGEGEESKLLKRRLWECLKQLFGI